MTITTFIFLLIILGLLILFLTYVRRRQLRDNFVNCVLAHISHPEIHALLQNNLWQLCLLKFQLIGTDFSKKVKMNDFYKLSRIIKNDQIELMSTFLSETFIGSLPLCLDTIQKILSEEVLLPIEPWIRKADRSATGFATPSLTFGPKSRHPTLHKTFRTGLQIQSGPALTLQKTQPTDVSVFRRFPIMNPPKLK